MTAYLDTSALIGWFDPRCEQAVSVHRWRAAHPGLEPVYNLLLQTEVRHCLRRQVHDCADLAWHTLRQAESAERFAWQMLNLTSVLRRADELSEHHRPRLQCGAWDLAHLVAATQAGVPLVTCDQAQAEAAEILRLEFTWIRRTGRRATRLNS